MYGNKRECNRGKGEGQTHFAIPRKVDFQCFRIVLEAKRRHSKEYVLAIDSFALLLLALFGGCHRHQRPSHTCEVRDSPSLVMNEMNSLTHSCMHSFASFAILALSGSAIFMIRATGAKLRMLASDAAALLFVFLGVVCGGEVEECGDEDDMALQGWVSQVRRDSDWLAADSKEPRFDRSDDSSARLEDVGIQDRGRSNPSTCRWERSGAQIKQQQRARDSIRTIGDWKPSVLLLDFEFVPESLRLCVCAFSIHVLLVSVRRLAWCDVCLMRARPRHLLWRRRHGGWMPASVCAGGVRSNSLATTSLGTDAMAWRPSLQPLCNCARSDGGRG
jgi:hypothetical protein